MRGEQADDAEARLLGDRRAAISSSSGKTGESMQNASLAERTSVQVVCQTPRDDDDDVRVQPDGAHGRSLVRGAEQLGGLEQAS